MVNLTVLAGGYTAFIATYVFDSDNNLLSLVGQSETGGNSSWLALHPTNKSILYAVNEFSPGPGALQSFVIDEDGLLSAPVSTASSAGDSPSFLAPLTTGQVGIMNYFSGDGRIVPTDSDGLKFDDSAPVINFPANVSHPHEVVQHGCEVLVPDLGADRIWRLVQSSPDTPGNWSIQGFIEQPSGSGPRHIALADEYLYVLHETANTLTSQKLPEGPNGTSPIISTQSIIPPNQPEGASYAAAEILIPSTSPSFPSPFVYTSNRNTGTQDALGDAITIFSRGSAGELDVSAYVYTGLNQIRSMAFFGAEDRYLIASGVAGDAGVLVFERTGDGGNLTLLAQNTEIPTRSTFVGL